MQCVAFSRSSINFFMELAGKLLPASLAFERTGHAGFGFVYRFKNRLLHFLKDRAVCVDVLVQKTGQPEYLAVGRGFLHNRLNLFGNALNFLIDDEGFAFVKIPIRRIARSKISSWSPAKNFLTGS